MRAEMGQNVSSRWLTIRLQFMGAFSLFVTSLGICLFPRTMDAGLTGMVINYALQATGTMESFIQNFTELGKSCPEAELFSIQSVHLMLTHEHCFCSNRTEDECDGENQALHKHQDGKTI
jgi:hypothetical protein